MFSSVSHFFNVLIFLDLILSVLCCILLIKLPVKYAIKFISIPLILFTTYVLIVQGEDIMGRAYNAKPTGQFEFIDYRVDVVGGVKKIEIWVVQEKKSRLYVIAYNELTEQQLSKAKTQRKAGKREQGQFTPGKSRDGKEKEGEDDLSIGDVPVEQILIPKDESN